MNILLSSLVVLTLAVGCFSARIPNIREYFNNGEELGRNFNHGIVDPCGCEAPKPPLPPDETPPAEVPAPEPPKVVLPPGLVIIPGFAESRNENKNRDKNNNENINKNDNHNDNGNILPGNFFKSSSRSRVISKTTTNDNKNMNRNMNLNEVLLV